MLAYDIEIDIRLIEEVIGFRIIQIDGGSYSRIYPAPIDMPSRIISLRSKDITLLERNHSIFGQDHSISFHRHVPILIEGYRSTDPINGSTTTINKGIFAWNVVGIARE